MSKPANCSQNSPQKKRPVLELIYHTAVFGPLHFHYDQPIIRVGRSEDNDLVLRHPSVAAHHCLLVFRDEKIFCLPPNHAVSSPSDLKNQPGLESGMGQQIRIGELQFTLAHSARSVAIPEVHPQDARAAQSVPPVGAGATGRRRYYCSQCKAFVPEAEIKRLGLVGHAKRYFCPKCSGLLELEREPPKPPPGIKDHLRNAVRNLTGSSPKHRR